MVAEDDSRKSSVTVHVRLGADELAEIDHIADAEGRARANLLARLIREALDARKRASQRQKSKQT